MGLSLAGSRPVDRAAAVDATEQFPAGQGQGVVVPSQAQAVGPGESLAIESGTLSYVGLLLFPELACVPKYRGTQPFHHRGGR